MAIISTTLIWSGETWSDELSGAREYERVVRVISDDPNESPAAVRAAVTPLGTAYFADAAAFCKNRSARRIDESRLVWEVTATFATIENEEEPDPLNRAPKIRWTSQLITKPVLKDRNGNAVVNSAGDYFDPPVEAEFVRWTANIQFNATTIPANLRQYAGAISSGPITIDGEAVAAERAKVTGLDISDVLVENDIFYRSITLAVEIRDADDDPFDVEALDQGFRIKDGTDLKDILIEDEDGNKNRPSAPVLLDGAGAKLSDPTPENAVFLTFQFLPRRDLTIFPGIST